MFFQSLADGMRLMPMIIGYCSVNRKDARKVDTRIANAANKYKDVIALAIEEREKVAEMSKKQKFNEEEIKYCMQFMSVVNDFEVIVHSVANRITKQTGKSVNELVLQ